MFGQLFTDCLETAAFVHISFFIVPGHAHVTLEGLWEILDILDAHLLCRPPCYIS